MIRHRTFCLIGLLALPAACSSDGEAGRAVAGNKAAANETVAAVNGAAASKGTAQSEIAAPTAASADCPYGTRNFQATVRPSQTQTQAQALDMGHDLDINWESTADAQGRMVEFDIVEQTPLVVAELRPGTMKLSPDSPGWTHAGSLSPHNAANTHVVLRCGGREIARVAIPRP